MEDVSRDTIERRLGVLWRAHVWVWLFGLLVVAGAVAYAGKFVINLTVPNTSPTEISLNPLEETVVQKSSDPTPTGRVLAESDTVSPGILKSENYRLGNVAVGGDLGTSTDTDQLTALAIVFVRGEAVPEKNKDNTQARALITWKTSKAALSTLEYAKNTGEGAKIFQEDGYGINHSAILTDLDPATTYLYTLRARDRFGNEVVSEPYAVYTGAKNVSLFELILGALTNIFGWALKR